MYMLHSLLSEIKAEFAWSQKGKERGAWFIYTLIAIILPFTSSKTSNLLRTLRTLFGFNRIGRKRYYTFMASSKIPWKAIWVKVWQMIPEPETNGRLLVALDDFINPKTGKKIFGCARVFDHAAKENQSRYLWAQNVVSIGLLKVIKGRWACLPLCFRFYHQRKEILDSGKPMEFQSKHQQAVSMIDEVATAFPDADITVVADSWFGNSGMWKPLRGRLGKRAHMISRLRANNNLFAQPEARKTGRPGRPRKYGKKIGSPLSLAVKYRDMATEYKVDLYGRKRSVYAYDMMIMLKTLKCAVRVVWIYRKTQWLALYSTDLGLSVSEIIEYYGARWKIEALFKELKRDIGSADTQTRNEMAVTNHLDFCMMATTITWVYACKLEKTPNRRHAVHGRKHFAFSDVRRALAKAALSKDFTILCPPPGKPADNSVINALLRLAA